MPAHMRPPQAAGFVEMCVRPFEMFAPPRCKASHARRGCAGDWHTPHPGPPSSSPVAPPAIRLGDVRPQIERPQIHQHLIAVIPLVGHHLVDHRRLSVRHDRHRLEFLRRGGHRLGDRRRVALIGHPGPSRRRFAPVSRSTACSALCARCVRPSFIFVMRASGSCGWRQSVLWPFFGRFRSTRARSARVGVSMPDAGPAASETPDMSHPSRGARCSAAPRWPQALWHRIPNRLSLDEIGRREHLQDPGKDARCVSRSIRRRVREIVECSVGPRPGPAPGSPAAPANPRCARQSRAPNRSPRSTQSTAAGSRSPAADVDGRLSRRRTGRMRLDKRVERVRVQDLIQPLIERMPARDRQRVRRDPQSGVRARSLRRLMAMWECSTQDRSCRSLFAL